MLLMMPKNNQKKVNSVIEKKKTIAELHNALKNLEKENKALK